jgi:NADPH:quinone reductase-like Zn-dependent oxidoreductase
MKTITDLGCSSANEVEKPAPKDNEILVKYTRQQYHQGLVGSNWQTRIPNCLPSRCELFGLTKPKNNILGYEVSGEVEAVGKDVKLVKKGDQVFGTTTGLKAGAYAEYVCLPEEWKQGVVTKKPAK